MPKVFSGHIDEVDYDAATGDLRVRWANGRTSVYLGVPTHIGADIHKAPSIGQALHQSVKGRYEHRDLPSQESE